MYVLVEPEGLVFSRHTSGNTEIDGRPNPLQNLLEKCRFGGQVYCQIKV